MCLLYVLAAGYTHHPIVNDAAAPLKGAIADSERMT